MTTTEPRTGVWIDEDPYSTWRHTLWIAGTGYPRDWDDGRIAEHAAARGIVADVIGSALALRAEVLAAAERRADLAAQARGDRARAEADRAAAERAEAERRALERLALERFHACAHERYTERTVGYQGTIDDNPLADGGVCYVDTCRSCAAERRTNVNGRHEATTGWYLPDVIGQADS